jgi:hypothetical protein
MVEQPCPLPDVVTEKVLVTAYRTRNWTDMDEIAVNVGDPGDGTCRPGADHDPCALPDARRIGSLIDVDEWDRAVVVIDRLADLGASSRMPLSRSLGDGLRVAFLAWRHGSSNHLPLHPGRQDHPAHHIPQAAQQRAEGNRSRTQGRSGVRARLSVNGED